MSVVLLPGHYLRAAAHNVARNKLYAAINVLGLAAGCTAALLIAMFVRDELGFDRWLPNHERIYRVAAANPGAPTYGVVPSDVGQWLALDFPQIESVTRLFPAPGSVRAGDREFNERIWWADANVFDVLELTPVAGNLATALARPDGLVLTRATALKYFGRADPIGATLVLDSAHTMEVTAVVETLPSNTHLLDIALLAPGHAAFSPAALQDREPLRAFGQKLWNSFTYFKLARGASIEDLRAAMPALLDRRTPVAPGAGMPVSSRYVLMLQPIAEIHLSPGIPGGPASDLSRIYAIGAIGVLIVLAAAINFVNLLTAIGTRRATEVGVRKVLGARRRDLVAQFVGEALLHTLAAGVLAAAGAALALPAFNAFLNRRMDFYLLSDPAFLAGAALGTLALGVLAGLYPALVLSAFRPVSTLKSTARVGGAAWVRQGLVVVQFAILIGLLIASTVIYRQMQFGTREALRALGSPVLVIETPCLDALKNELAQIPAVAGAACAWQVPQLGIGPGTQGRYADRDPTGLNYTAIDFGLLELYGLELAAGRSFDAALGDAVRTENTWTTPERIVINETAARNLGFTSADDAIGKLITWNRVFALPATFTGAHDAEIVGVVKDFQLGSVRQAVRAAAFFLDTSLATSMSVKIETDDLPAALEAIDAAWQRAGEPRPIQRAFFADSVQGMYVDVVRQVALFGAFAGVAIFIAALGLVGLVAFVTERRTKEIGIRKTLGGTRAAVVRLLLWQFSKPVLLANLIAWPAAFVAMRSWLGGFARHVDLDASWFFAAGAVGLALAVATIFTQAYRTAGTHPVDALRDE